MKTRMFILVLLFILILSFAWSKLNKSENKAKPIVPKSEPKSLDIENYCFGYMDYSKIISTIKTWEQKAPLLIDVGSYGKTTKGKDCFYFKISNENKKCNNKIMVTASIHGNEPWSTNTIMAYAGWMLSEYGKEKKITEILDTTEIYFVPVVSPDSYPYSRTVDGVDPNRNFPSIKSPNKKSIPPVNNLRNLFLKIKPDSVISGHTYGRVFLIPWGETKKNNPNHEDYKRIVSEMSSLSGYKWMKSSELYGRPIIGTESDWYHSNGAFAIVIEFGSHQKKPKKEETEYEFNKTKNAFIFFLEESIKVDIQKSHNET